MFNRTSTYRNLVLLAIAFFALILSTASTADENEPVSRGFFG